LNNPFRFAFISLSVLIYFASWLTSSGYGFEKRYSEPIPAELRQHPLQSSKVEANFCTIQYDVDSVAWFSYEFESGEGIAVLMDPADCSFDSTYPFKISNVHFYLYDFGPQVVWPVQIKVSIRDVYVAEDTLKPGTVRSFEDFTMYADSAYDLVDHPNPINLSLGEVVCVDTAFFLQITFLGDPEGSFPSLLMSDTTDRPDTNENWLVTASQLVEWYEAWDPIPGRTIMRATGYPYAIDCNELCWSWIPEATKAPSGMPDFDQYQFGTDSIALCGPSAVADHLVWLNAIPSITDPDSLIRLLSFYFRTDPAANGGTRVDSLDSGLDSLFAEFSLSYRDTVLQNPKFSEIADSLKESIGSTLLLGFWQRIDETWYRIGGHYVSSAGACKTNLWMALADPALDNAETGARGRFLPPHDPHPEDDILHNTQGFVSHDAYLPDTLTVGPYEGAWILWDLLADSLPWGSEFEGLNFQPDQQQYTHSYDPAESLYAVVEYAVMILRKPTLVEEVESATPKSFELFQSYPNPFNNQAVIRYSLSKPTEVSLAIYNVLGQKVRTLVKQTQQNGLVNVIWDGKDDKGKELGSGIYFYRLEAGGSSQTKRMVLLK
jgi:hypothetical protein